MCKSLHLYDVVIWTRGASSFDERDMFDLNWRYVHGPTTTFQRCALATHTPTPVVVRDIVEHDQPNHEENSCKQSKNIQEQDKQELNLYSRNLGS
jgi:hypothetical protein